MPGSPRLLLHGQLVWFSTGEKRELVSEKLWEMESTPEASCLSRPFQRAFWTTTHYLYRCARVMA